LSSQADTALPAVQWHGFLLQGFDFRTFAALIACLLLIVRTFHQNLHCLRLPAAHDNGTCDGEKGQEQKQSRNGTVKKMLGLPREW